MRGRGFDCWGFLLRHSQVYKLAFLLLEWTCSVLSQHNTTVEYKRNSKRENLKLSSLRTDSKWLNKVQLWAILCKLDFVSGYNFIVLDCESKAWLFMLCCIFTEYKDVVELCARELGQFGDQLYWKYKLLEILINNYKTVYKISWDVTAEAQKRMKIRRKKVKSQHWKKSLWCGLVGDKVSSLRGRAGHKPVETNVWSQCGRWTYTSTVQKNKCGRWLILRPVDDWTTGGLSADADSTTHLCFGHFCARLKLYLKKSSFKDVLSNCLVEYIYHIILKEKKGLNYHYLFQY